MGSKVVSVRVPEDLAEDIEKLGLQKSMVLRKLMELASALARKKTCEEFFAKLLKLLYENNADNTEITFVKKNDRIALRRWADSMEIVYEVWKHGGYETVAYVKAEFLINSIDEVEIRKTESCKPCMLLEFFDKIIELAVKSLTG